MEVPYILEISFVNFIFYVLVGLMLITLKKNSDKEDASSWPFIFLLIFLGIIHGVLHNTWIKAQKDYQNDKNKHYYRSGHAVLALQSIILIACVFSNKIYINIIGYLLTYSFIIYALFQNKYIKNNTN